QSPGSSNSNSSIQTREYSFRTSTVVVKVKAPTRFVYSTNVPKAFFPGAACHRDARRWVLPTPKPRSRYTPLGCLDLLLPALREKSDRRPPDDLRTPIVAAKSRSRSTAPTCDGCAGSGMYVSKDTSPKRYEGWNPARSSSGETLGFRSDRATISVTLYPISFATWRSPYSPVKGWSTSYILERMHIARALLLCQ